MSRSCTPLRCAWGIGMECDGWRAASFAFGRAVARYGRRRIIAAAAVSHVVFFVAILVRARCVT